jgi:hypothetical protein
VIGCGGKVEVPDTVGKGWYILAMAEIDAGQEGVDEGRVTVNMILPDELAASVPIFQIRVLKATVLRGVPIGTKGMERGIPLSDTNVSPAGAMGGRNSLNWTPDTEIPFEFR